MRTILVTGGAGFIGSAFVRKSIELGYSVINFDALTYASSLASLNHTSNSPKYKFIRANICDREAVSRVLTEYAPDAVVHFAAESHVDRSIEGPLQFIDTNIRGTAILLEACREYLAKKPVRGFRFLHVSTDEVFGSLSLESPTRFDEHTSYRPNSPYAASKAASDHLVRAWSETYDFPALITNCSNNYGPFQFPEKLIPVTILNGLRKADIPLYGDGQNVRDWLYVYDHVDALHCVLERGEIGDHFVIGGDNECSNLDLMQMICEILDEEIPCPDFRHSDLIKFVDDRLGHDRRYAIDATYINKRLGWSPSVQLRNGIRRTVLWYINNPMWWKNLIEAPDRVL